MKKITKSTKSSTPATKPVVSPQASRSIAKNAIKPTQKSILKIAPVAALKVKNAAIGAKKSAMPAPTVKPVAAKPLVTIITAKIDVGFGNALYVRGEGAGLSWDRGVLLDSVSDTEWSIILGECSRPIIFKFLVNDLSWSAGEDYTITSGETVLLEPTF